MMTTGRTEQIDTAFLASAIRRIEQAPRGQWFRVFRDEATRLMKAHNSAETEAALRQVWLTKNRTREYTDAQFENIIAAAQRSAGPNGAGIEQRLDSLQENDTKSAKPRTPMRSKADWPDLGKGGQPSACRKLSQLSAAEPGAPPEHCINEAPPAPDNSKRLVSVAAILADDRAQPRAALMDDQVAEYAEEMGRGDQFPPLVVFQDKEHRYWLADGFHRYHAAVRLGLKTIECVVHQGGLRDAVLFSCGANAMHGVRRSNADKREAVAKLLRDGEWAAWSDSEIGRRCRVSHVFVAKMRERLARPHHKMFQDEQPRIVSRGGTTYTQNTGNIGKSKRAEAEPPQVETKIVTVEAPATGVTETGTAVVKARGVMPDPPSPARKPADREAAAFENIARQLDCLVEITEAMTPEGFLNVRGSYTPVRLNGIVDDALFAIGWLQKFVQLARSDSRLDDTPQMGALPIAQTEPDAAPDQPSAPQRAHIDCDAS